MTPGFSPADLENVLNEAALLTARRDGKTIRMDELEEAITKVMAGPAKKSRVVTEKERKLTAYHEAGHAVLIRNLPNSDPVHQVTIIPRGMAGGMTMFLPKEDRTFESKNHMMDSLTRDLVYARRNSLSWMISARGQATISRELLRSPEIW